MLEQPFDIISCSWPRPVEHGDSQWRSEPEWDAPLMPVPLQPHWEILNNELCWTMNWRELFRSGIRLWNPHMCGEMRGFHVVFHLKINGSGWLTFWDDDSCIIRRNGEIIHYDRSAHPLSRHEIEVSAGDHLEVAQWQQGWDWLWGAQLHQPHQNTPTTPTDVQLAYLGRVQERLQHPNGPPLKFYTDGRTCHRAVAAIYSLVLNGYVPSAVYLFGEYQWSEKARNLFTTTLPFAQVVPTGEVVRRIQALGGFRLVDMARRYWYVMKTCISLLYPPEEFCLIDDDVFILDRVDDALQAFQTHDLVYTPDQDLGAGFLATWGGTGIRLESLPTRRFNAGLYWMRNDHDPRWLAAQILRRRLPPNDPWLWEQGFIATVFARKNTLELPGQRYLYPLFDGLPGGVSGYDYARKSMRIYQRSLWRISQ